MARPSQAGLGGDPAAYNRVDQGLVVTFVPLGVELVPARSGA
jgi:hypothetical protein